MRHIAKINCHQAEASTLQKQIGNAQRLLESAEFGRRTLDPGLLAPGVAI
jgi:hypothetical protein